MQLRNILFISIFAVLLAACANSSDSEDSQETTPEQTEAPSTSNPTIQPGDAGMNEGATASNVSHYICPNNCEGSGGNAAGTCPVCGTAYVHNSAFHQQQDQSGTAPNQSIDIGTVQSQQQTAEPPAAQNAAGEWHFACSAGCGGGAGSSGNCPNCGAPLQHNQAYHQ